MKVGRKDVYIAYVQETAAVNPRMLEAPTGYSVCASQAVNLLDFMAGEKITYIYKLGSTMTLDLRQKLGG